MACLLVILLLIFWQYAGQYNELSENLAISSKFNLSFKDELDLEVYYIAIGAKESSEMEDAIRQVEDAQAIVERLRKNTYHSNGVKSSEQFERIHGQSEKKNGPADGDQRV